MPGRNAVVTVCYPSLFLSVHRPGWHLCHGEAHPTAPSLGSAHLPVPSYDLYHLWQLVTVVSHLQHVIRPSVQIVVVSLPVATGHFDHSNTSLLSLFAGGSNIHSTEQGANNFDSDSFESSPHSSHTKTNAREGVVWRTASMTRYEPEWSHLKNVPESINRHQLMHE